MLHRESRWWLWVYAMFPESALNSVCTSEMQSISRSFKTGRSFLSFMVADFVWLPLLSWKTKVNIFLLCVLHLWKLRVLVLRIRLPSMNILLLLCINLEYGWSFSFFEHTGQTCGILVPLPGIEPVPHTVDVWNLNHWSAREAHGWFFNTGMYKWSWIVCWSRFRTLKTVKSYLHLWVGFETFLNEWL